MSRTMKAAGTAVDKRNGRRAEVAASSLAKFALPRRPDGKPRHAESRKAWAAFWADDSLSGVLRPVDRPVLVRWVDAVDRALFALEGADADPVVPGHAGQPVENPLYGVADKAVKVAQACEAQLGVGALNRARLGIAILAERESMDALNARIAGAAATEGDDDDPR